MEKPNLNNESRRLEHRLKERFVKAMATYHLIEDDDRILVGLSGGKDSLLLTELLANRAKIDHPRFSVEALHVRMENIQYETDTSYLQQFCDEQGVKLHLRTTRFEIGEETVNDARDARRQKQPCFLCSWMRRKEMFNLAQELGCNKIASTPENAQDATHNNPSSMPDRRSRHQGLCRDERLSEAKEDLPL